MSQCLTYDFDTSLTVKITCAFSVNNNTSFTGIRTRFSFFDMTKKNIPTKMAKVKQIKRKVANAKKALPAAVSSEWKKVKLAGKLITNDGGAGLEGLLGVEVLENYNGSITRQKLPKVSAHRTAFILELFILKFHCFLQFSAKETQICRSF